MRFSCLLPLLVSLLACTPALKPEGSPPRPESVGAILLRLEPDNLDTASLDKLAAQVAANLAGWGYAIDGTADSQTRYTHSMWVSVGQIDRQSTPTGFSFGVGNSDPRSPDFQQAAVLPVTCRLESNTHAQQSARVTLRFVAEDVLKTAASAQAGAKLGVWVNHIGTACFNLLSDLHIKRPRQAIRATLSGADTSAWIPEVRIEVRKNPLPPQAATPSVPTVPDQPARVRPTAEAPKSQAHGPSATRPVEPALQTETQDDEGRKQIIIHNQGSPVILEFGYERK
jgi:hypothetical protein